MQCRNKITFVILVKHQKQASDDETPLVVSRARFTFFFWQSAVFEILKPLQNLKLLCNTNLSLRAIQVQQAQRPKDTHITSALTF